MLVSMAATFLKVAKGGRRLALAHSPFPRPCPTRASEAPELRVLDRYSEKCGGCPTSPPKKILFHCGLDVLNREQRTADVLPT